MYPKVGTVLVGKKMKIDTEKRSPQVVKLLQTYATRLDLPIETVVDNLMISYAAKKIARKKVWDIDKEPLLEFCGMRGEELFRNLLDIYAKEMEQEKWTIFVSLNKFCSMPGPKIG